MMIKMRRSALSPLILLGSLLHGACAPAPREVAPAATPTPAARANDSTIAVAHGGGTPAPGAAATPGAIGPPSTGSAAAAGGINWKVPKRWETGPARSMRVATYQIPPSSGDGEAGECGVFFFGPGQGGGVEANIERWIGQFKQPDGSSSASRAKQNRTTINGLQVTTIDLRGTFEGGGPMMGQPAGEKPGYRLLGAIVEAPEGAVFFKLTGPERTVEAAQEEFQTLLRSIGT
jgi:hypothetical protein